MAAMTSVGTSFVRLHFVREFHKDKFSLLQCSAIAGAAREDGSDDALVHIAACRLDSGRIAEDVAWAAEHPLQRLMLVERAFGLACGFRTSLHRAM